MKKDMNERLPAKIEKFFRRYRKHGVAEDDCLSCSSFCCSHAGYAILDNVIIIYELYKSGSLKREDYEFPGGLTFEKFVRKYFDVFFDNVEFFWHKKSLATFYMRSLSSDNHLIAIPGIGWYHQTRDALFESNPWLNKGCVFLNKKIFDWREDDKDTSRHCILHSPDSNTRLTSKPIGCVFHTCNKIGEPKVPSLRQCIKYNKLVSKYYSNSVERFLEMVDDVDCEGGKALQKDRRNTLIKSILVISSIALCWVPFLGFFVSIVAVFANIRSRGLKALLCVLGLVLSICFTVLLLDFLFN